MPRALSAEPWPGARSRLRVLLKACHPEPAALVTALTTLLTLLGGRGWGTLAVTAAVGCGQLSIGWANDYTDRRLDRESGRRDKPLAALLDDDPFTIRLVRNAGIAAGLAAVVLSVAVGIGFAAVHLVAIGAAMAYNAGLKARPLSVLPYAIAFGLLPVAVALSLPRPHLPPAWAIAAGALMGAGAHFTQALPDIEVDRRLGIMGLPQLVGPVGSGLVAAGLMAGATLLALLGPGIQGRPMPLLAAGAVTAVSLTAGVAVAALRGRARLAFRLTMGVAATAVIAFLASGARL